ncbi:MAG: amidophosphoribosyltransferase [Bacteroides sp.]
MSDSIQHECGIALLRLKQPLQYYQQKYGSWCYGLQKMYLLMEKQHNRGQDGAGIATVKFDMPPGFRYIDRARNNTAAPIKGVFAEVYEPMRGLSSEQMNDPAWAKSNLPFAGELFLGHLRYGTYGGGSINYVHPQIRANNWKSRTLVMAGNFNLTNTKELFNLLVSLGQHPQDLSDTVTVLEKFGHFLDDFNQQLFRKYKDAGHPNIEISELIAQHLDIPQIIAESTKDFDGGYTMGGLIGHGDAFVCRDPWGIRPAFYMDNDEVTVVASERPVIQTVMNVRAADVHEIKPGFALIIRKGGTLQHIQVREPQERHSCSFERIYFSRGTDKDIYRERLKLGELLAPQIERAIDGDFDHTVFSFIPNTAETAYYGMIKGLERTLDERRIAQLVQGGHDEVSIREIMRHRIRIEKIAVKDIKLRTFIAQEAARADLVPHVYDVTYGTLQEGVDTLVVIDDSIVRGTTLRDSILRILDRLGPRRIVVVSSSPQVRYPDCYGIDMARLEDFIAFRAAIELLKERGREALIAEVYEAAKAANASEERQVENCVQRIYAPFSAEELSLQMSKMLRHPDMRAEVHIEFQSVENLHLACPNDTGDWYFTGDYPTPGGARVANQAYINYMEGNKSRAY